MMDAQHRATAARLEATLELAADALAEFAMFNGDLAAMDPADPDAIRTVAAAYLGIPAAELPIVEVARDGIVSGPNLVRRDDGRCVLLFAPWSIAPEVQS